MCEAKRNSPPPLPPACLQATEYLLAVLAVPAERGAGFTALGEMAGALARAGVASRMKAPDDFLRPIAAAIRDCLGQRSRGRPPCPEALECAGNLAVALRADWQPYLAALLEPTFTTGLSGEAGRLGWGSAAWVAPGRDGGEDPRSAGAGHGGGRADAPGSAGWPDAGCM